MTLREKIDNVSKSEIFKLMYNDKVIGLRVKIFDVNNDIFDYYDFTLKTISGNKAVKDFVNSLQSGLRCIELYEKDGLLISMEEMNNTISVKEFKSEKDAIAVLGRVKKVYEFRS